MKLNEVRDAAGEIPKRRRRRASDFNCFVNYLLIALMEKVEKVGRDLLGFFVEDKLIFSVIEIEL